MSYQLLDSGEQKKIETFGPCTLIRPAAQAVWPKKAPKVWLKALGCFTRQQQPGWQGEKLPSEWTLSFHGLKFKLQLTDFGHLGLFPEHAMHWEWMAKTLAPRSSVLNLFAYSGGATLFLAKCGHRVCHLDASDKMVSWARGNARINGLEKAPIRWIIDDAIRFLRREVKRRSRYDGVLLDPPSFGRGSRGQVFKIDQDIYPLLKLCGQVLSSTGQFVLLTTHTPGFTPLLLEQLLGTSLPKGKIDRAEMCLQAASGSSLPSGAFARWERL